MTTLNCFKTHEVRGAVPQELDATIAYRLALAYADRFRPAMVVIGRDGCQAGVELAAALAAGFEQRGVELLDLGLCGKEELYFAAMQPQPDGGLMVSGCHQHPGKTAIRLVRAGALPISRETGLDELERAVAASDAQLPLRGGRTIPWSVRAAYASHLLGYLDQRTLRPLRIAMNPRDGAAGLLIEQLSQQLPFHFMPVSAEPGVSPAYAAHDPLLPENRALIADAVQAGGADLGLAWDGDLGRCYLFDERGALVPSYYLIGLVAEAMLARHPGAAVVHDPYLIWNTRDSVEAAGGTSLQSRAGRGLVKERMRADGAVYGCEASVHHYFRDLGYRDSGMIPWLLVAQIMSVTGEPLSALVGERQARFPASGELQCRVRDVDDVMQRVRYAFDDIGEEDPVDGLSFSAGDWRFNLRRAAAEQTLLLNVEARGDRTLMQRKTDLLLALLD